MSDEWVMVPRDLLQRVDAALQRHLDRHAPMRIPVDQTDSDLVQSDVQALIAAPTAPLDRSAPARPEDMAAFAAELKADSAKAQAFFQSAGIIDERGELMPEYAAPQQAEPVAQIGWSDEFGNLFPMGAWKPTQRTHHDSHKAAWRPVFLHPPADEVQRLRDAARAYIEAYYADDGERMATFYAKNNALEALRRVLEGGE